MSKRAGPPTSIARAEPHSPLSVDSTELSRRTPPAEPYLLQKGSTVTVPTPRCTAIGGGSLLTVTLDDGTPYSVLLYGTITGFEEGWWAQVLALPGCTVEGKTQADIEPRIRKAIEVYRRARRPQRKRAPAPPPRWRGPVQSWAMVLALVEAMNSLSDELKGVDELRLTNPNEASQRKARLDDSATGYPGAVWKAEEIFKALSTQGSDAALEAFQAWLNWDPSYSIPHVGHELAESFAWPPQVKQLLFRLTYVHYGYALWTLLTSPELAHRLKQCPHCQRYFIAGTKNGVQRFCTPPCREQYWTYTRRTASGHRRGKKRFPKAARSSHL